MRRRESVSAPSRMQYVVNLAVIFLFCVFLGRNHINVISVIRLSQEGGDALKVGGSGKGEGYGMTLHTNNGKPVCISFCFMNFYSQRGDPLPPSSPLVTPLIGGGRDFFLRIGRGVWHDYLCKKDQT